MTQPTRYISYGAGVGSTALLCYMIDEVRAGDIEVVFSNHGCDMPENYEYLAYVQKALDIEITQVKPDIGTREGNRFENLYDYFIFKQITPSIHIRSCTFKAKIEPFYKYAKRPSIVYMGITYDEKRRAKDSPKKYTKSVYPLVDAGISRMDALKIIEDAGLSIPQKSGCYFCPFQSKTQWRALYDNHRELFEKAVILETNAAKFRSYLLPNVSIVDLKKAYEEQTKLDDYIEVNR